MILLLPYPSFEKSAEVFDRDMLQRQKEAARDIIKYNAGTKTQQMWEGCHEAVKEYHNIMAREVAKRKHEVRTIEYDVGTIVLPKWWGWSCVHRSHRSYLLFKSYQFYKKYKWPDISSNNLYYP